MTVALATLTFLIAAWAGISALLVVLDENGAKIFAALKGQSALARGPVPVRSVTIRFSVKAVHQVQPVRAQAEWRAAA